MKEKKELRVGDKFTYNGKLYLCQYGSSCEGCIFDGVLSCSKPYEAAGSCSKDVRSDGRDVIFVEIGKEKPAVPKTEFAVGEEFAYGLKTLRCVPVEYYMKKNVACTYICHACALKTKDDKCDFRFTGSCFGSRRTDATDVLFVEVEPKD